MRDLKRSEIGNLKRSEVGKTQEEMKRVHWTQEINTKLSGNKDHYKMPKEDSVKKYNKGHWRKTQEQSEWKWDKEVEGSRQSNENEIVKEGITVVLLGL